MHGIDKRRWFGSGIAAFVVAGIAGTTLYAVHSSKEGRGQNAVYENPILDHGADPWVTTYHNQYLMTMTTGTNVTILHAHSLSGLAQSKSLVAWAPSTKYPLTDVWAPELHHIGDKWYVYFAADTGHQNASHRMYVLESSSNNPLGSYHLVGQLKLPGHEWAIDGTVLSYDHQAYFIWSGWPNKQGKKQNLYIAKMSSPTHVSSTHRVMISTPTYAWETSQSPINEGPEILQYKHHIYLIYSANASWTNAYCLGMLTLTGNNPMLATNWTKSPHPVFQSANGVYGPGHASFVQIPNSKKWYIVYHAAKYSGAGWNRMIMAQPFQFDGSGRPAFGSPLPTSKPIPLPKGPSPWQAVSIQNVSGGNLPLTLAVGHGGRYTVAIRYINNTKKASKITVHLPALPALTFQLPPTGTNPSTKYLNIYLTKGDNQISLTNSKSVEIQGIERSAKPIQ